MSKLNAYSESISFVTPEFYPRRKGSTQVPKFEIPSSDTDHSQNPEYYPENIYESAKNPKEGKIIFGGNPNFGNCIKDSKEKQAADALPYVPKGKEEPNSSGNDAEDESE